MATPPQHNALFADTVTTQSVTRHRQGHGWMGIRFQNEAGEEASDIIIHVEMPGGETVQQQEAIGILGVNLMHAAFYCNRDPMVVIHSLMDDLNRRRVDVDMIKFSGPAFAGVDNRLMSLELVEEGLTDAVLFTAQSEVVQPSEVLYERCVLIERGSFRPVTDVTLEMLVRAQKQLEICVPSLEHPPVVLMEMTLSKSQHRAENRPFGLSRARGPAGRARKARDGFELYAFRWSDQLSPQIHVGLDRDGDRRTHAARDLRSEILRGPPGRNSRRSG